MNDRTVRVIFSGRDDTGNSVRSVTQSLKELKQAVREGREDITAERRAYSDSLTVLRQRVREERNLRLEFTQNHQTMFKTINAVRDVGNVAQRVNSLFINHNLYQMRVRDANEALKDSFVKLQDAIGNYGKDSLQAAQAQKEFNEIKRETQNLNNEEYLQYGNMALGLAGVAGSITHITANLAAWKAQRLGAFDPIEQKVKLTIEEPTLPAKGGSSSPVVDDPAARLREQLRTTSPLDNARINAEYAKLYRNQPVKPPIATTPEGAVTDLELARRQGTFTNRINSGFTRIGGNELTAIASIVAPIALASPEVDKWLEENLKVNLSRANEDKQIHERGIPERHLFDMEGNAVSEGQATQNFYNEYDKKLAGDVNITVYVNSGGSDAEETGNAVAEKTAEAVSKYAQHWSSAWG